MGNTISKQSISAEAAQRLISEACKKATEIGFNIAVTVVDEGGNLKAFHRMDGAPLIANSASKQKAFTAIGFGMPTGDAWYGFIKDDPILMHGAGSLKDFTLLGGGSPIMIDENLVGAFGVSGGHYKQDEECVEAALSAL